MMAKANEYNADSIQSLEEDRDRLQKRPTMYLPSTQKDGALHIIFEIIDNAIDECTIKGAVGTDCTIIFDNKTKECIISDTGRGVPHENDMFLKAFTVINTSGKFDNTNDTAYTHSGGTFGAGAKIMTYLSDYAEITSVRNGMSLTYRFEDGILVDTVETKVKKSEHGTTVKFRINPTRIDSKDVTVDDIVPRLKEKSYVFPDMGMTIYALEDGKQIDTIKLGGKDISDYVSAQEPDTEVIYVDSKEKVSGLSDNLDKAISIDVNVRCAFGLKEEVLDMDTDAGMVSYVNSIKTYEGGTHIKGLKKGIEKYFREHVIPKLGKRDSELQITPTDMCAGLVGFIVVNLNQPEFKGQHKDQITTPEVSTAVRNAVYDAMCGTKQSIINEYIDFVKRVTRGRMASKKTRKKDVTNVFSKDAIDKYRPLVNNLNTVEPELILVEGDSVLGNAVSARDPYNQAVFTTKKPKNIFDYKTADVAKLKTTINDIFDILGIEPGKPIDIDAMTFKRVLIMTDADVDGDSIAILIMCLLAKHCPELIKAGIVGRIIPPAYAIPKSGKGKGGKYEYVNTQREFFGQILKRFVKDNTVSCNGKEMSKDELSQFISMNFEYDIALDKLAHQYCCDALFLEHLAWSYHGDLEDQKIEYWTKALKAYPDLRLLTEKAPMSTQIIIDGDIPGKGYINLAFDERTHKHMTRFKKHQEVNNRISGYSINGVAGKTVYDVMHLLRSFIPKGVKRFKGLGELSATELSDLCMDKEKRTVVIFKFKDFDEAMEKMSIIMSSSKHYSEARMNMMMSIRADDLDIDT